MLDDIVVEARRLVGQGAKELVLTGQDTTFFGRDTHGKYMLAQLLKELNQINGVRWIRLLYAYPSCVTDELIDAIGSLEKVCHYLDMPLQHISDKVLQSMRRGTTKKSTYALIEKMRKRIPDLSIRTTFIVGHPGEGESEFQELLEFMETFRFDRMGMFTYSNEEGSHAATLAEHVSEKIKEKRFHAGMLLQQKISKENNERLIGKTFPVLIEGRDDKNAQLYHGRTYMDAPEVDGLTYVEVPKGTELKEGEFVLAKVHSAKEYDLMASYLKTDKI